MSDDKTKIFSAMRARTQENIARQKAAEYTPTTAEVRECWSEAYQVGDREGAFNRWLAAHDAGIRADQIEKDAGICQRIQDDPEFPKSGQGVVAAKVVIRAQPNEGKNDE